MATPATVDEYVAGFPPDVRERLERIRSEIVACVPGPDGGPPEERVRYGIAAVMLAGRYALRFAGCKKHIGLYAVPRLPTRSRARSGRTGRTRTPSFPHTQDVRYDLVGRVAAELVRLRRSRGHQLTDKGRPSLKPEADCTPTTARLANSETSRAPA